MRGWTPALRIARRELLRARGRTALVLLMVLLPVAAVACLSTLLRTSEISVQEGLPQTLGSAQARLESVGGRVVQDPLLSSSSTFGVDPNGSAIRPTEAEVREALPEGSRLLVVRDPFTEASVEVDDRRRRVNLVGVDLRDEQARGPYAVLEGRVPTRSDEVAVSRGLAEVGLGVGDAVLLQDVRRTVTAVVAQPEEYGGQRTVLAPPGALGLAAVDPTRYYASGPPVGWQDVQGLNELGLLVLSRAVVLDPPPADQVPDVGADPGAGLDEAAVTLAVVALVAVMAVLEVVLLAGPAFAVGARRQRRGLALLAATGGEPRDVRRVVLAQGLLVGVVAVVVGLPLGVAVAALARAPLAEHAGATWGTFDVSALDLGLLGALGAATALLAALAPAWVMSRQPVVAALQGRRVTSAGAARPALLGLVLLGIGLVVTVASLRADRLQLTGYVELGIAAGAIPTVLGVVLLAPAALSLVGRSAARLPLALRFAVRDADRQRGRTAPAVAAIAATVAGVVALGTTASSDAAEQRRSYTPYGPPGVAVVSSGGLDTDWERLADVARRTLPGEPVQVVQGLAPPGPFGPEGQVEVQICRVGEVSQQGRCSLPVDVSSPYGTDLLVGPAAVEAVEPQLRVPLASSARAVLAAGGVLLPLPGVAPGERFELRQTRFSPAPDGTERVEVLRTVVAEAARLPVAAGPAPARAVLSEQVAQQLGGAMTVALVVGDDLGRAQEQALQDALVEADDGAYARVELGYDGGADRTAVLVLALVAGTLVLGGTLAATALALSEARTDLSTLGQVGARPRTRKAVAAGYALVLGLVGGVLGVAAGLVPGIAASVPLTQGSSSTGFGGPEAPPAFVVDVPWLLLLLVLVGLPLVSAAVAGAVTRGRLDGPTRVVA